MKSAACMDWEKVDVELQRVNCRQQTRERASEVTVNTLRIKSMNVNEIAILT